MQKGKFVFKILKIAAIVLSVGYVAYRLRFEQQLGFKLTMPEFGTLNFALLIFSLMLVPVNWLFEAIKFKQLVKPLQPLKLGDSIKGVLAGVTVSIFTPKRIGDFGGRVFVLNTPNRVSGVFATLLGSLSQLTITLILGCLFFAGFAKHTSFLEQLTFNAAPFLILTVGLVLLLIVIYFNISAIGSRLMHFNYFKKHAQALAFISNYSRRQLLLFLSLSFLRYAVFTLQFFMLLKAFGGILNYYTAMLGISQVYIIMAVMPTFALDDIGVRGSVAVWVFGLLLMAPSVVLTASTVLWIFNLALPALAGVYFLYKLKY